MSLIYVLAVMGGFWLILDCIREFRSDWRKFFDEVLVAVLAAGTAMGLTHATDADVHLGGWHMVIELAIVIGAMVIHLALQRKRKTE